MESSQPHVDLTKAIEQVADKLLKPVHTPVLARQQGRGHKQGRTLVKRAKYERTRKARRLMSKRSRQINRR